MLSYKLQFMIIQNNKYILSSESLNIFHMTEVVIWWDMTFLSGFFLKHWFCVSNYLKCILCTVTMKFWRGTILITYSGFVSAKAILFFFFSTNCKYHLSGVLMNLIKRYGNLSALCKHLAMRKLNKNETILTLITKSK